MAIALLAIAFLANVSGTRTLARVAKIGLAAELVGVIVLGLYLLLFQREQPFSVFFDSMGAGGDDAYVVTFLAASLSGLFLFYGFEACGDVAEEVTDPTRRIPKAMILTIVVGGVSGLLSYAGYVLAAPDLQAIVDGEDPDPIPSILESSLGTHGLEGLPRRDRRRPSSPASCRCRPPAVGCSTPSAGTGCSRAAAGWPTCPRSTRCRSTP